MYTCTLSREQIFSLRQLAVSVRVAVETCCGAWASSRTDMPSKDTDAKGKHMNNDGYIFHRVRLMFYKLVIRRFIALVSCIYRYIACAYVRVDES